MELYPVYEDWTGSVYWGITLKWYYQNAPFIAPFQDVCQHPYTIINIKEQSSNNIHHIDGIYPDMGPKNKWHSNWIDTSPILKK